MHLRKELDKLKKNILVLSTEVEENVRKAVAAISARDAASAQEVVDGDRRVDQMEVDLEEECLKILALHQPVAIDLRYIIAVLKINNDLERIGDLAVNIAQRAVSLAEDRSVPTPPELEIMVEKSRTMLRKSLDALVDVDATLARGVLHLDDEVDAMHRSLYRDCQKRMQETPEQVAGSMQILSVSRNLERIGDLATNIAEDVIYMINGEIVRHGHVEPGM